MKYFLILIVGIALIILAVFFSGGPGLSEDANEELMTETENNTETVLIDGTYEITQGEVIRWQGRKPLLNNYFDSGNVSVKNSTIEVAGGDITGEIVINMESINALKTGKGNDEDKLSSHLKSEDFFNVEKFPTATFVISRIEKKPGVNQYDVFGNLTVKGISNEISFPATIVGSENSIDIKGEAIIDRSKWDVRFGSGSFFSDLGDKIIDDNFTVTIDLVANKITE